MAIPAQIQLSDSIDQWRIAFNELLADYSASGGESAELTAHKNDTENPHAVTKAQVGLGSVPNYSATSSVSDGSASKFATAAGVKTAYDKAVEAESAAGNTQVLTTTGTGNDYVVTTGKALATINDGDIFTIKADRDNIGTAFNGNNFSILGTPTVVASPCGASYNDAVSFDGVDNGAATDGLVTDFVYDFSSGFTAELKIDLRTVTDNGIIMCGQEAGHSDTDRIYRGWSLYFEAGSPNSIVARSHNSTASLGRYTNSSIQPGIHDISISYDGTLTHVKFNGVLILNFNHGAANRQVPSSETGMAFAIGRVADYNDGQTGAFYSGAIDASFDEVRLSFGNDRGHTASSGTPSAPFTADADTGGLWHLDGALTSEGIGLDVSSTGVAPTNLVVDAATSIPWKGFIGNDFELNEIKSDAFYRVIYSSANAAFNNLAKTPADVVRTLTLDGDVTGTASLDLNGNVTMTVTITDPLPDHDHDDRYFTETESDVRFLRKDATNVTATFTNITLDEKLISLGDTDTYLEFSGPDEISLFAGAVAQVVIDTTNTTFAGTIVENSDRNLKENIAPLESRGSIGDLVPVTFNKKTSPDTKEIGFVAQDVEVLYPELVSTDAETGIKSVSYSRMTAVLLQKLIEMEERLKQIEGEK